MPSLSTLTIVGIIAAAGLIVLFLRTRQRDLVEAMMKKREASSKLVTRGDYMEGMQRIPVAMALTNDAFYYENPDMEASFELARIDEVEYAEDLATGKSLPHGCRVLRLRSHGAVFEFVLAPGDCQKWMAALPPHRMDEPTQAAAV